MRVCYNRFFFLIILFYFYWSKFQIYSDPDDVGKVGRIIFFGETSPKSDIKNSKFLNEVILDVFILPDVRNF
jgi:DNA modification methylase